VAKAERIATEKALMASTNKVDKALAAEKKKIAADRAVMPP